MNIEKDELLLSKRLKELGTIAYKRGICTYSDFLNLDEINTFNKIIKELPNVNYKLYGGHQDAERKIVAFFLEDSFMEPVYPICCIQITPRSKKFSDTLTHRDFLGAILNLGIERTKIGDILIKENEGFVFIENMICDFVINNLIKIKHTSVKLTITELDIDSFKPSFKEITANVPSFRLDAILPMAFSGSRSSLTTYITSGKVYVNSKLTYSNSLILKEGDIVSVRGLGKFAYKENTSQTKKGRYYITIQKYI